MTTVNPRPLSLGKVFDDVRRVLAQRGLFMLLFAFALVFPAALAAAWLRHHPLLLGAGLPGNLANSLIGWLVQVIPTTIFVTAGSWAVAETFEGRPPTLGEMLSIGLRFAIPATIVQGLYTLGLILGMVLLVVPGIIVALMWVLVTPVLVIERLSIVEVFGLSLIHI